jgi:hypothetical protein
MPILDKLNIYIQDKIEININNIIISQDLII